MENTSKIEHLIPKKRPGRKGVESGMHSGECMKRHLVLDKKDSCWIWPDNEISNDDRRELLAISIEISIKFFFKNFMYNFGGEDLVQEDGGPIGARLTMAVAHLVLQEWSEKFSKIFNESGIRELLRGIYVDDGRNVVRKISNSMRFDADSMTFCMMISTKKKIL